MLQLLGMRPVVVHGGGPRIDAVLQRIGKKSSFVQGMRVTDAETMEVIEWVLAGEVQGELVALINRFGGQGVGLTGTDGALIRVHKLHMLDKGDPGKLRDIGQVGEIEAINPIVIKALQDDGFIPVISPIGFDADGKTFNINADIVAGKIAEMLRAEKLVILTNAPGVLDRNGRLLGELNAHQIDELFADGAISCGMLPKISSALNSAKNGVNTVHIIDGRVDHSLLSEILTDQGVGTMILG
jgi:acetylglutamate kinase